MSRRFVSYCMPVAAWVVLAMSPIAVSNASAGTVFRGSATGTVTYASDNSFTIQTAGPRVGLINALTAAATKITNRDYPYVYGGGHARAGVASVGERGPGYNGHRRGFDCSGSVAAVLAAGGLWPAGSGVPSDAGIIATLRSEGLIARGVGKGPAEVTLYDRWGIHIFMNIDGRFFGTSDGAGGGNPRGGAGWLDDGAPDASRHVYKPYHFRLFVLKRSVNTGHIFSFQAGALQSLVAGLQTGEEVQVDYEELASGAFVATSVSFPGTTTTSGSVTAIAPDLSSFTIQTASGASLTFSTANDSPLIEGLAVGDTVEVTYATVAGTLAARAVTITATADNGGEGGSSGVGGDGYGGS